MLHLNCSIDIARPAEEVYDFVVDAGNDPEWCDFVLRSELVSGSPGQPGARFRQVQKPGPVGRRIETQLLECDPPKRAQLQWRTSVATFDVEYLLEETLDGCRLTQESAIDLHGWGRLSKPLVRLAAPRSAAQQLQDLKSLLEESS